MNTITIQDAILILTKAFQASGSDAAHICARAIIAHVFKADSVYLIQNSKKLLSPEQWTSIQTFAKRHENQEPLAYILGHKEFYGRDFLVNEHTLIPRPESEDVLEAALLALDTKMPRFIDIGTGSGCLGLSVAAERKESFGLLLDIKKEALNVACQNIKNLGLMARVFAVQADLRNICVKENSLDLIIANPPYISEAEYVDLLPNVRNYEPKSALVPEVSASEQDDFGLIHIEYIARQAFNLLKVGGVCVIEHGSSQAEFVKKILAMCGQWAYISSGRDLAGLDRFCLCKK